MSTRLEQTSPSPLVHCDWPFTFQHLTNFSRIKIRATSNLRIVADDLNHNKVERIQLVQQRRAETPCYVDIERLPRDGRQGILQLASTTPKADNGNKSQEIGVRV